MLLLTSDDAAAALLQEAANETAEQVSESAMPSAFEEFLEELPSKALDLGVRVVIAALAFIIFSKVIGFVVKLTDKAMTRSKVDESARGFICSFVKAALYIILIFIIAAYLGVDAASIVAILGSAGVAVGLALQGSLSNLAGGILIMIVKPFEVGDYIVDNGTKIEGTVTEIEIFYTKLRTFDNKLVVLPNGSLSGNAITNVTHEKTRRIDVNVSVAYSADLEKAKEVLSRLLASKDYVLKDKEHVVVVNKLGDNGVELIVRFWTQSATYWDAYFDMTESVKLALDEAGVEIPFPQVDVHMKS